MGKDKKEENLVTAVSILKRAVALVEPYERHDETADKLARILERNLEHFQEVLKERPVWSLIEEADAFLITSVYEHAEAPRRKQLPSAGRNSAPITMPWLMRSIALVSAS